MRLKDKFCLSSYGKRTLLFCFSLLLLFEALK